MYMGKNLSMAVLRIQKSTLVDNKRYFVQQFMLGWAFVLPLCLKMVNTELFLGNSLVVRKLDISIEFHYVLVCSLDA